jgi:periplasmic protein TonB
MMQTGIFDEREKWGRDILRSVGAHILLIASVIGGGMFSRPHENWGGSSSGDAMPATLVSSIPLPSTQEPTKNIVATEDKGLSQSVPHQAEEQKDAIPIPDKQAKRRPDKTPITQPNIKPPQPVTPANDNVIPSGGGGALSFSTSHTKGAFTFQGTGDFGSRFAWYVQTVNRKVSDNWYTVEVNSSAQGKRVYLTFDILRDGSPTNVQVEQSSGIPALDQSAVRALQRIDTFGPLPPGYSGSKVSVEFWFDYQK